MEYIIRQAVPEDAGGLLENSKICGSETTFMAFGPEGLGISLDQERKFLEDSLNSSYQENLVLEVGGKIVGSGTFSRSKNKKLNHKATISICIQKAYWGQGLGSALIEKLIDFGRSVDEVETLYLGVRADNKAAIHLYEKFSFKKFASFESYYKIDGKYYTMDMMRLDLK